MAQPQEPTHFLHPYCNAGIRRAPCKREGSQWAKPKASAQTGLLTARRRNHHPKFNWFADRRDRTVFQAMGNYGRPFRGRTGSIILEVHAKVTVDPRVGDCGAVAVELKQEIVLHGGPRGGAVLLREVHRQITLVGVVLADVRS